MKKLIFLLSCLTAAVSCLPATQTLYPRDVADLDAYRERYEAKRAECLNLDSSSVLGLNRRALGRNAVSPKDNYDARRLDPRCLEALIAMTQTFHKMLGSEISKLKPEAVGVKNLLSKKKFVRNDLKKESAALTTSLVSYQKLARRAAKAYPVAPQVHPQIRDEAMRSPIPQLLNQVQKRLRTCQSSPSPACTQEGIVMAEILQDKIKKQLQTLAKEFNTLNDTIEKGKLFVKMEDIKSSQDTTINALTEFYILQAGIES